jgi:hypothetical protein
LQTPSRSNILTAQLEQNKEDDYPQLSHLLEVRQHSAPFKEKFALHVSQLYAYEIQEAQLVLQGIQI